MSGGKPRSCFLSKIIRTKYLLQRQKKIYIYTSRIATPGRRNMKMSLDEHYRVLGCTKESSYADLKAAYRKLVLLYHPDKTSIPRDKAAIEFHRIEEAWRVLRDPASKQKYDARCRQAELEARSFLIFATITGDEMQLTEDEDAPSYRCGCGGYYLISRQDLLQNNGTLHIPCQECTFVLVVET